MQLVKLFTLWIVAASFPLLIKAHALNVSNERQSRLTPWDLESTLEQAEQNIFILNSMANTFRPIREENHKQYGVMYLPPPYQNLDAMHYNPPEPNPTNTYAYYPYKKTKIFPSNYVACRPYNGIHTEAFSLKKVFPGMRKWYLQTYSHRLRNVFLYTYYLPCPKCYNLIRDFVISNKSRYIVNVGYSTLYGGNQEYDDQKKLKESRVRRDDLQDILNLHKGGLYKLEQFE